MFGAEKRKVIRGHTVDIYYDPDPQNPRTEFDNASKMYCWHRRYRLGDPHDYPTPDDFDAEPAIIKPLYLYDHSGLSISTTPFACPWDSGQVGWIVVDKDTLNKEWDGDKEMADKCLEAEVREYNHYLTGAVFGVVIDKGRYCEESCWGFFGHDHKSSGLMDFVESITATQYLDEPEYCI